MKSPFRQLESSLLWNPGSVTFRKDYLEIIKSWSENSTVTPHAYKSLFPSPDLMGTWRNSPLARDTNTLSCNIFLLLLNHFYWGIRFYKPISSFCGYIYIIPTPYPTLESLLPSTSASKAPTPQCKISLLHKIFNYDDFDHLFFPY